MSGIRAPGTRLRLLVDEVLGAIRRVDHDALAGLANLLDVALDLLRPRRVRPSA